MEMEKNNSKKSVKKARKHISIYFPHYDKDTDKKTHKFVTVSFDIETNKPDRMLFEKITTEKIMGGKIKGICKIYGYDDLMDRARMEESKPSTVIKKILYGKFFGNEEAYYCLNVVDEFHATSINEELRYLRKRFEFVNMSTEKLKLSQLIRGLEKIIEKEKLQKESLEVLRDISSYLKQIQGLGNK